MCHVRFEALFEVSIKLSMAVIITTILSTDIERSINEHANIVHAVKNCYKRKIDYRELRSVFLCFLRGRRPLYIPIRASLPSKCSPFGRQRSPKCNATGVLLESNSCPFAKKRSPFKDSLFAHLTSS